MFIIERPRPYHPIRPFEYRPRVYQPPHARPKPKPATTRTPKREFAYPAYDRKPRKRPSADTTAVKVSKPDKVKTIEAPPAIPAGPLHVIVSIDAQRATLYANGAFVASTKVSTGTKSHPTPMGVFSVIQKNRHHVSNLYGASMPYMQRLTWSGTALHAGPLPGYPASHGCVRLTNEFAQLLWKATKIGARVIVTREDVKPVDIAHVQLAMQPVRNAPQPEARAPMETTGALVRTADATSSVSVAMAQGSGPSAGTFEADARDLVIQPPATAPSVIDRKNGPVSIFISRKDRRLYVRQAMQPLFDLPLTLRDPDRPIGTHVYTVMEMKDGAMRWTAVSIPSAFPREAEKTDKGSKNAKKFERRETAGRSVVVQAAAPSAGAALSRFDMPPEVLDRLAGTIAPGTSLIMSDNGIAGETGKSTDFIVLTR